MSYLLTLVSLLTTPPVLSITSPPQFRSLILTDNLWTGSYDLWLDLIANWSKCNRSKTNWFINTKRTTLQFPIFSPIKSNQWKISQKCKVLSTRQIWIFNLSFSRDRCIVANFIELKFSFLKTAQNIEIWEMRRYLFQVFRIKNPRKMRFLISQVYRLF